MKNPNNAYSSAKKDPLIHRLLCLISSGSREGTSVQAGAPVTYNNR